MKTRVRVSLFGVLLVVLLVLIGLCVHQARAQEYPDYPPGDDQIVPLAEGERAPFDGQLFSTDTAIRWGFRLQTLRLRLDADIAREREICAAQNDLLTTKMRLAADNQAFQLTLLRDQVQSEHQQVLDLTAQLAEAEDPPWYSTFGFGLAVGVIGALVLVIATGYALGSV